MGLDGQRVAQAEVSDGHPQLRTLHRGDRVGAPRSTGQRTHAYDERPWLGGPARATAPVTPVCCVGARC